MRQFQLQVEWVTTRNYERNCKVTKEKEIQNSQDNQVRTEVPDQGKPLISCPWVITIKENNGSKVVKARFVAPGFNSVQKASCLKQNQK